MKASVIDIVFRLLTRVTFITTRHGQEEKREEEKGEKDEEEGEEEEGGGEGEEWDEFITNEDSDQLHSD